MNTFNFIGGTYDFFNFLDALRKVQEILKKHSVFELTDKELYRVVEELETKFENTQRVVLFRLVEHFESLEQPVDILSLAKNDEKRSPVKIDLIFDITTDKQSFANRYTLYVKEEK